MKSGKDIRTLKNKMLSMWRCSTWLRGLSMGLMVLFLSLLFTSTTFAAELKQSSSPVSEPGAVQAKCDTPPGGTIELIRPAAANVIVRVALEYVQNTPEGSSCFLRGQLRIGLPGNDITAIAEGRVDAWDNFYSTSIGEINVNIAGLTLHSRAPKINGSVMTLGQPEFILPGGLGGGSNVVLVSPKITADGLRFSDEVVSGVLRNTLDLPAFKIPNGIQLVGLNGDLISEADGFKISVTGRIWIPYMKLDASGGPPPAVGSAPSSGSVGITASFSIFINAAGNQVITFNSLPDTRSTPISVNQVIAPNSPTATDSCFFGPACLSAVSLDLNYRPGINLDGGYAGGTIWLVGVRGSITLLPHDTQVTIGVTIETSTLTIPLLGAALRVDGDAALRFAPELAFSIRAALRFFILEVAEAQVEYSASRGFYARIGGVNTNLAFMRYEGEIRVWGSGQNYYGYSGGPVYVAGSGRAGWYLNRGQIFESCTDLPCGLITCYHETWIWFFGWHLSRFPYLCGINYCRTCVAIPPERWWLAGGAADIGRFKGGLWGMKGSVSFLFYSTGVFLDLTTGQFAVGDVSGYVLDSPTAARAIERWRAERSGMVFAESNPPDPRFTVMDEQTLLIKAPVGTYESTPQAMSAMRYAYAAIGQPRAVTDAITTTHIITQTDTGFSINSMKPLAMSLITPNDASLPPQQQGVEISKDNYESFAPELKIAYTENLTYTKEVDADIARWRYMSASLKSVTVTVQLDGQTILPNVISYAGYISVTRGSHLFTITPENPAHGPAIQVPVEIITGTDNTLLTFDTNGALAAKVLNDNRKQPSELGRGNVRFVNVASTSNEPLDLYLNNQLLVGDLTPNQLSAYVELPAGDYLVDLRDNNGTSILTNTLTLVAGDHYSVIASDETLETNEGPKTLLAPVVMREVTTPEETEYKYIIDQAPVGDWQVKLTGSITETGWTLAVFNAANPPIISDFVVDATNIEAVEMKLALKSDYAPTSLTFFVTEGPITTTATITNTDGTVTTEDVPNFHGEVLDTITVTERSEIDGSTPLVFEADLSFLESGDYYIWVQVEDGVSPSVNQYASLASMARAYGPRTVRVADADFDVDVQVAGAAAIHVDHTADFENHFVTTVITPELHVELYQWDNTLCPQPQEDEECKQIDGEWGKWVFSDYFPLYNEWTPSLHPDTDGYVVKIEPVAAPEILATETFTVGDSVYEVYDDKGNFTGVVGYHGWSDAYPDASYRVSVGAMDYETDKIAWSQATMINIPLGTLDIDPASARLTMEPGGSIVTNLLLDMSEDLFYDVDVTIDLENLPPGLEFEFVDEEGDVHASRQISPRGRLAPGAGDQAVRGWYAVARLQANGQPTARATQAPFAEEVAVRVTVEESVEEGTYRVPVVATAGPVEVRTEWIVQVGDAQLQLPWIKSR